MSKNTSFPTRAVLIESTYKALVACNGSATNDEILDYVIELLKLPDEIINIMHGDNMQTKLQYELRWARTYLKKYFNKETLYLWESDINNDVKLCEKIIMSYIENKGILKNYNSFNYYLEDDNLKLMDKVIYPYYELKTIK